jgi:hypothetical protein
MQVMDWGDAAEFVSFGKVSAEDARCDVDVFVLICPQNIVGSTIMTNLGDMVCMSASFVRTSAALLADACTRGE